MVSPYLMRPLRSLQEAVDGVRVRVEAQAQRQERTLKAEGLGVQFWDSRQPAGPRLVWTNSKRDPAQRS